MFVDNAKIIIKSGKGGDGHVSFRREKYVPDGGPNGGDGGRGGNVVFVVDENSNTLINFRHKRKFVAESGKEGGKNKCSGAKGEDLIIKVPKGTIIKDAASGMIIHDMSDKDEKFVILKGGRGGKGNMHYATSTMQAPKFAQPGGKAKELEVILELKMIADVGLAGFPNAGKSTFLSRITNARPKIADYPFTTIEPGLGVVDVDDESFVIADIPGLIEGAADGLGMGHEFLKHIERCRVIIHMVDGAAVDGRDPVEDVKIIKEELFKYNEKLSEKNIIIAINKSDIIYDETFIENLKKNIKKIYNKDIEIFTVSAATGEGIKPLLYHIVKLLKEIPEDDMVFEAEYDPESEQYIDDEPFYVEKTDDGTYDISGPKIERMLGYTNLEAEKGFLFFQNFMKENGIIDKMKQMGIEEGDTVKIYGHEFEYYE